MKIVLIANGYPNKRDPQWGCFERDQALALSKLNHQVSVLYADKRFRTYWRKIGCFHFKEEGIDVYGIFIIPTQWIKMLFGVKIQYWVSKHLLDLVYRKYATEQGNPDIIYAHYLYNIAYAVFLKKKYGIPLVGIEHWSKLSCKKISTNLMYLGCMAYKNADKLLAVSKSLEAQIYYHFNVGSTVVYNMLGAEFANPSIRQESLEKGFTFIAVGSLISRKGFDLLISAFAKSNLTDKGCSLIIVGDGEEKNRLSRQIHELGLSENVVLAGRKSKHEIINIMSDCNAFILSSRAETFGVVCIEAMSQGLPVIATRCGGPEEFISENNGILIPTEDIDAMALAMRQLYDNYGRYDIKTIVDNCMRRFSPQVIAKQLSYIFSDLDINRSTGQ